MPIDPKAYPTKEKYVSEPGSRYRAVYTSQLLEDGTIELVQTGVEDLQEMYDAQRSSCDMSVLVERYLAGDLSALNRANPMFLDLLGAPQSLMEAYQIQFRAHDAFDTLPASVREKFDNDFNKFIAGAGSPEWFDALKIDQNKVEKEVDTSES